MELYGKYGKSIPQKITITIVEVIFLYFAYWVLFQNGGDWVQNKTGIFNASENISRRIVIYILNLIIFFRILFLMIFLLKRKISWDEAFGISFAFIFYYIAFLLFVLPVKTPIDLFDFFAIGLFVFGSFINTGSEILRDQWKKIPSNKGKIYTEGFFKYSRHINYFGDILWVTAYAILTRNIWALTIPLLLFCFFAFYNAPKLDKYLKKKYTRCYDEYAKKTKMLIPFIY